MRTERISFMRVVEDIEKLNEPFKNAVVTIGNFDGVHKGHQALFARVREKAREIGGTSVAVTFEPHPVSVLRPDLPPLPRITVYERKVELISSAGMDALVCLAFTPGLAKLDAKTFLEDILIKRIGMKAIVVGGDYAFGRNREGDVDFLKRHAGDAGFEVLCEKWVVVPGMENRRISSTVIREKVMEGDVETAAELLGRPYQVCGTVVPGRGRGAKILGFPTANMELKNELCPGIGVYAVSVEYGSNIYKGVANIGFSPTFEDHQFTVEVHILDFEGDLGGRFIRVNFIKRLRDEKRFETIEELKAGIANDVAIARKIVFI